MWILISNISESHRLTDLKLEDFASFLLWVLAQIFKLLPTFFFNNRTITITIPGSQVKPEERSIIPLEWEVWTIASSGVLQRNLRILPVSVNTLKNRGSVRLQQHVIPQPPIPPLAPRIPRLKLFRWTVLAHILYQLKSFPSFVSTWLNSL